eukprot:SAG11_NODE_3379_length_2488_cov_3.345333_3_plen_132_part_00
MELATGPNGIGIGPGPESEAPITEVWARLPPARTRELVRALICRHLTPTVPWYSQAELEDDLRRLIGLFDDAEVAIDEAKAVRKRKDRKKRKRRGPEPCSAAWWTGTRPRQSVPPATKLALAIQHLCVFPQ